MTSPYTSARNLICAASYLLDDGSSGIQYKSRREARSKKEVTLQEKAIHKGELVCSEEQYLGLAWLPSVEEKMAAMVVVVVSF